MMRFGRHRPHASRSPMPATFPMPCGAWRRPLQEVSPRLARLRSHWRTACATTGGSRTVWWTTTLRLPGMATTGSPSCSAAPQWWETANSMRRRWPSWRGPWESRRAWCLGSCPRTSMATSPRPAHREPRTAPQPTSPAMTSKPGLRSRLKGTVGWRSTLRLRRRRPLKTIRIPLPRIRRHSCANRHCPSPIHCATSRRPQEAPCSPETTPKTREPRESGRKSAR